MQEVGRSRSQAENSYQNLDDADEGSMQQVFNIDVSICPQCGGEAKVIASIEDQPIIDKILSLGP
jgi:hypothetical protein